ncbi:MULTISPECIES: hypothetical protein [Peribacillus]|uniref:hypothetical protein n=1 Tax=Peribacillus TaxID=2675229 RepID=UPI001F4EED6A|nr:MULTISPECIES: hypothetical protein [unclassified Peribacillus]MCK1981660.1 hypothetical protein [Peribacillus sp. Aquil_B1]MCK2009618.1 hypothetical protein [Peribacillus sp. Aquil_B8]
MNETILATLGMACYLPLFFMASSMTGMAIGIIITLSSAPIIAGFLEWLFIKERPSTRIATSLSIAGCLLLFSYQGSVAIDPVKISQDIIVAYFFNFPYDRINL